MMIENVLLWLRRHGVGGSRELLNKKVPQCNLPWLSSSEQMRCQYPEQCHNLVMASTMKEAWV